MYCRNCGKEISDDSKFCQHCGTMLEGIIVSESIQEEMKSEVTDTDISQEYVNEEDSNTNQQEADVLTKRISTGAYLGRRLIGTIIDKMALLVICFIAILVIGSFDLDFYGELGIFSALFHMTIDSVHSTAIGHVMINFPEDYMSQHQLEIDNRFQYLIGLELKITSLFILINLIYYVLCELLLSSSVGKFLCRLKIISAPYYSTARISPSKVFFRALCFLIIIGGIIALRWVVGFNYYVAILLFFLVMDLPVFFKRQSLLDIMSRSKLIYGYNNLSSNSLQSNEKVGVISYYKSKTGELSSHRFTTKIVWLAFFVLSLCSIHIVLSYFFADYLNLSNYDADDHYLGKGAENDLRKSSFIFFPSERFCALNVGNKFPPDNDFSLPYISADAKFLSKYSIKGSEYEYDYYSYSRYYHYVNEITTFDISEMMKRYIFEYTEYDRILKEIEVALRSEDFDPQYTTINGKKALKYYINSGTPTKRLITCANKRLYFFETQSELGYKLEEMSYRYCSQFFFNSFHTGKYVISYFLSLIFYFLIVIGFSLYSCNGKVTKNRYALSLFVLSIVSFIINIVIASYQAYGLFTDLIACNSSVYVLAGSLLTVVCVSTPLCVFYWKKSKELWKSDYIVPLFLKNQYDYIKGKVKKRAYVLYICYPLMALSLLPLGIYIVLLYCVPILIICSILIWFNKWRNWAKASKV